MAEQGRYQDAVRQWQRGLSLKPDEISIILLTAWVLATNPDPAVRDGAQAVELAERANRLAGGREPAVLDVLAAAYAEARRFADAVEIARRALDLASAQGNAAVADALRAQSQLYQAGRPFRDTDRSLVPGATQRTGRTGGGSSR